MSKQRILEYMQKHNGYATIEELESIATELPRSRIITQVRGMKNQHILREHKYYVLTDEEYEPVITITRQYIEKKLDMKVTDSQLDEIRMNFKTLAADLLDNMYGL